MQKSTSTARLDSQGRAAAGVPVPGRRDAAWWAPPTTDAQSASPTSPFLAALPNGRAATSGWMPAYHVGATHRGSPASRPDWPRVLRIAALVGFVAVPLSSYGYLPGLAFLFAAVWLRSRWLAVAAAVYLTVTVVMR